ncbi:hypothetical protein [Mycoplasmopsis meleagridis]|uniref:hypothetical protein n=1 Tax=Mycoplasmopsis meleagridis TaxID=29561 RepID=UPI00073D5C37|nr:hypothetical protein [Mycoplasmopsis meleagridis]KUH47620.1 hypothetical protein ASB56_00585 [Mycoplasmopsis meleagridis]
MNLLNNMNALNTWKFLEIEKSKNNEEFIEFINKISNNSLIYVINSIFCKDIKKYINFSLLRYKSSILEVDDIYNLFLSDLPYFLRKYLPNLRKTNFKTYLEKVVNLYTINKIKYWNAKKRNIQLVNMEIQDFHFIEDKNAHKLMNEILSDNDLENFYNSLNKNEKNFIKAIETNDKKLKYMTTQKINFYKCSFIKKVNNFFNY